MSKALAAADVCSDIAPQKLKPMIACAPTLLQQARDVLGGNGLAAETLRETLGAFGGAAYPTSVGIWAIQTDTSKLKPSNTKRIKLSPARSGEPRLVAFEDLETVLAATVYVSRTPAELAVHLGGMQLAIQGVDEMQHLYRLALDGAQGPDFSSAFDTAVRVLSSTPGFPFEPGRPGLPGVPFGPPGAAPWFDWPPGSTPPNTQPRVPTSPPLPTEVPRGIRLTDYFERCLTNDLIPEMHRRGIGFINLITNNSGAYRVTSIDPASVCPGARIDILGSNFNGTTEVRFVNARGETISAEPSEVSDDKIEVVVPLDARSGPVWPYIPVTVRLCLTDITTARPGVGGEIEIGVPVIHRFGLEAGRDCVGPGDPATLNWSISPDTARVTIVQIAPWGERTTLVSADSAIGTLALDFRGFGRWTYELEADVPGLTCGITRATRHIDVAERGNANYAIAGIEVTQGIQVFSLEDPPPEPNNSIDLIDGMDTIVRVYLRSILAGDFGWHARCTGTLTLDGTTFTPINEDAPGVANPFIETVPSPRRDITNNSLNFQIPAALATGLDQRAVVEVFNTGVCAPLTRREELTLSWLTRPALPVTIRRIAESDRSRTPRSVASSMRLVVDAFRRMPSPRTAIVVHPGVFQIEEGTTEDNYCNDGGYYQLALSIAYEHNDNEGYPPADHTSSWIGLYERFGCSAGGMMAWPSTSTCISQRSREVIAHELLHTVGLGHTKTSVGEDCESLFQPVACHILRDASGVDRNGLLIHVPFDIDGNTAVRGAADLQSYRREERWLSAQLWVLARTLMDTRYPG
ncbi:hypothetical protein ACERZ8_20220 [Tateyamaria armeniaca]|uniref:IPT/TIG domain-containing protein n=1 Tax=Tateyamaria armeniaca TaxID=2518930 RepID=A0ABW8UY47_9RHOB